VMAIVEDCWRIVISYFFNSAWSYHVCRADYVAIVMVLWLIYMNIAGSQHKKNTNIYPLITIIHPPRTRLSFPRLTSKNRFFFRSWCQLMFEHNVTHPRFVHSSEKRTTTFPLEYEGGIQGPLCTTATHCDAQNGYD
jgi:hypothetical protein